MVLLVPECSSAVAASVEYDEERERGALKNRTMTKRLSPPNGTTPPERLIRRTTARVADQRMKYNEEMPERMNENMPMCMQKESDEST